MASWHQENKGLPSLQHPTLWRCYNPRGHLSVMTFQNYDDCMKYCNKTGDIPVAPAKL